MNLSGRSSFVKVEQDGTWFPADPVSLLYHDLSPRDHEEQVEQLRYGSFDITFGEVT